MKSKIIHIIIISLLAGICTSCQDEYVSKLELNRDVTISEFSINDIEGVINENKKTINVTVPLGTDVSNVSPVIQFAEGASITPIITGNMDFTVPVEFLVTNGNLYSKYKVTVSELFYYGFLGEAPNPQSISIPDDKAAADWFFSKYENGEYISFDDIENGNVDLSKYLAIWWPSDQGTTAPWPTAQQLIGIADNPVIVDALRAYYENGGSFLLTSFAGSLVDELGVVSDPMYSPNQAFGDAEANEDSPNWGNWGIRWLATTDHMIYKTGLNISSVDGCNPHLLMLPNGVARRNRTNQYNLDSWTVYWLGDTATPSERVEYFEDVTGGKVLAGNCGMNEIQMVEWPAANGKGSVIVIGTGTYDWYAENGVVNTAGNIEKLTANSLLYFYTNRNK